MGANPVVPAAERPLGPPSGGHQLSKLTAIELPALGVLAPFGLVGQSEVAKSKDGCTRLGRKRDLDRRRAGRHGRVALPTPAHHQPTRRIDPLVFAAYE